MGVEMPFQGVINHLPWIGRVFTYFYRKHQIMCGQVFNDFTELLVGENGLDGCVSRVCISVIKLSNLSGVYRESRETVTHHKWPYRTIILTDCRRSRKRLRAASGGLAASCVGATVVRCSLHSLPIGCVDSCGVNPWWKCFVAEIDVCASGRATGHLSCCCGAGIGHNRRSVYWKGSRFTGVGLVL